MSANDTDEQEMVTAEISKGLLTGDQGMTALCLSLRGQLQDHGQRTHIWLLRQSVVHKGTKCSVLSTWCHAYTKAFRFFKNNDADTDAPSEMTNIKK